MDSGYFQYRASASNLTPDTSYEYSLSVDGTQIAQSVYARPRFKTASRGASFTFLHFADSGTGADSQHKLAAQMMRETASLVLANGDLAYDMATHRSVENNYFSVYRELMAQIPFFASLGNHEYNTDAGSPSLAGRVTPTNGVSPRDWGRYYSFDWGNIHFVALDSNSPLARVDAGDDSMLAWLENDLNATRKFWRVVFFHHPPYATGSHQNDIEPARARQHIVPILERHGVQVVFNGHEHNYQRTLPMQAGKTADPGVDGTVYVTSGGGGQTTYQSSPADWIARIQSVNHYVRSEVSGGTLTLAAVAPDGSVFDTTFIAPKPRIMGPVTEAASFSPKLASGSVACVFGWNLCIAEALPKPSSLDAVGTSVWLGENPIPILYADSKQINLQIPLTFHGSGVLEVRTANGAASVPVTIARVAPVIFVFPDGTGRAIATHADGTLVSQDAPTWGGEEISLILTGLGVVEGTVSSGELPRAPLRVIADVRVTMGSVPVEVLSVHLGTSYPGVYEVRVRVSSDLVGNVQVEVTASNVPSNTAFLPIA